MAKDKGMKEEDMFTLLKDRSKGENAYKNVSTTILIQFWQPIDQVIFSFEQCSEFQYVFEFSPYSLIWCIFDWLR